MPLGAGRRRAAAVAALLGAFAIGAGATAATMGSRRATVLSMAPAPITTMRDWSPVADTQPEPAGSGCIKLRRLLRRRHE